MYDVVIVGAGPAGLTAGIYTRTKRLSSVILEAQQVGGQLSCLYPFKIIHDYPSYTEVKAKELVQRMAEQVKELGCEIREGEEVTDLIVEDEKVVVKTPKGTYEAKGVILAVAVIGKRRISTQVGLPSLCQTVPCEQIPWSRLRPRNISSSSPFFCQRFSGT